MSDIIMETVPGAAAVKPRGGASGGPTALPRQFVYLVIASSALPYLLMLAGVDFGAQRIDPKTLGRFIGAEPHLLVDAMHHMLSGSFTHTLLEWSAFMAAIFTVALAFTHFSISRDAMTPIIGMALFSAGVMDAFHTLAADRLFDAAADNRQLIPFTWAISRLFNALILIVGIGLLLMRGIRENLGFVIMTSLSFGVMAYVIIQVSATSANLPQTMFPEAVITRPWDVGPLLLFLVAGVLSYRLYRRSPTFFSGALVLSMVPSVATEAHMAFGSTALFDSHFNVAHGLKILSYAVPLMGLCLDYVRTHQSLKRTAEKLAASQAKSRAIVDVAVNGVITIDEKGVIDAFNPAAERIFGYAAHEVIGRNVSILMPEPYHSAHDGYLSRHMETGENRIIGIGREVSGRRKDGSTFPLKLAVGEAEIDGGKLFVGYVVDITSTKETEAALITAKEEAEKANRAKTSFLSMVSHELRTPLTSIIGNLPLLTDPDEMPAPAEAAEIATDIVEASDHLLILINDLLDFSKIEAGKLLLERETIAVADVIDQAVTMLQPLAEQKRLRLRVDAPDELYVDADPIRLKQVFINLIGNAIKFTGEGEVSVEAVAANGNVTCVVRDTGVGVPEEMLPVIFDKFRQADSSSTRKAGGTGLGLAITKNLIEMHGGEIKAENNADGGSSFTFNLPAWEGEADGDNPAG